MTVIKKKKLIVLSEGSDRRGITIHNMLVDKPYRDYDVKCDRTSPLGNPVGLQDDESKRNWACDYYSNWFYTEVLTGHKIGAYNELMELQYLYDKYKRLRLFCWCVPKRCHVETIKRWLENNI